MHDIKQKSCKSLLTDINSFLQKFSNSYFFHKVLFLFRSVAEAELPEAATSRVEPIFVEVGADSQGSLFKAAPAVYFTRAKKKSLVLV